MSDPARQLAQLRASFQAEGKLEPESYSFDSEASFLHTLKSSSRPSRARQLVTVSGWEPDSSAVPSARSFEDLVRVSDLRSLRLNEKHTGKYILLRVLPSSTIGQLSDPLHLTITLPVCSPSGCATLLRIRYFPLRPSSLGVPTASDVRAVFPDGQILAVKEPRVGRDLLDAGRVALWVDSKSDLAFIEKDDPLGTGVDWVENGRPWEKPKEAERPLDEWKNLGNKEFASKNYLAALRAYTTGLNQHPCSPSRHLVLLNRAHLNNTLERHTPALADLAVVLETLSSPACSSASDTKTLMEKALSRQAAAFCSLRRWSHALETFSTLANLSPELPEGPAGIAQSEARLNESSEGAFDIRSLYQTSLNGPKDGIQRIKHVADYISPSAIVGPIKGKGRGLIATKEIQPGEIILAVRSLALVSSHEIPSKPELVRFDLEQDVIDRSSSEVYTRNVLWRLADQPELATKVSQAYLGPNSDFEMPPDFELHSPLPPPFPALKQKDIPNRAGLLSFPTENENGEENGEARAVRPKDISRAVFYNASTPFRLLPVPVQGDSIAYAAEEAPGALFSESALINHSCAWNAYHCFFGDFQITRATQLIPAHTEILASYVPDLPLQFRSSRLEKYFGKCTCTLCETDRLDPGLDERPGWVVKAMRESADDEDLFPPSSSTTGSKGLSMTQLTALVKKREEITRSIDKTYLQTRRIPRVDRYFGHQALRTPLRAIINRRLEGATGATGTGTGATGGKIKIKELAACMRNEVSALDSLGVRIKPDSFAFLGLPSHSSNGTDPNTAEDVSTHDEAEIKGMKDLPISTPPMFRHSEATRTLLAMASLVRLRSQALEGETESIGLGTQVKAWLDAAVWVEDVTVGGGLGLFKERWQAVLENAGLIDLIE
ncbi:FOG: TPR repeat [Phaffia rhodozyma]|uniref:FOG: TPR repeat n=1 Tax=Phaffia rhodozyma TaxID=264483 RepID=A0A0F7STN6_PHARH|nr:FOG: TPR repeat [Phaffia rhodozyma]